MESLLNRACAVWGVANSRSIAWSIAKKLKACGAEVILISHPDVRERVEKVARPEGVAAVYSCDVTDPKQVDDCFEMLAAYEGPLFGVVHSIAWSDKDELEGRFVDTTLDNFLKTMAISVHSFIDIAARSARLMTEGGCILTLTFDASQGPYPHYNLMGPAKAALEAAVKYVAADLGEQNIRVNGISTSPQDTLSARAIKHFRVIGDWAEGMSPLGRRATLDEIAHEAASLMTNTGVTGQIRYVDCGSGMTKLPSIRNARKIDSAMRRVLSIVEGGKSDPS